MIKNIGRKIKLSFFVIMAIVAIILFAACEKITNVKLISHNELETEIKGQTIWNNENGELGLETTDDKITTNQITVELKNVQIEYESEEDLEYKYYIKTSSEVNYKEKVNTTGKEKRYTFTNLKSGINYDIKVEVINSKTQNKVQEELKRINTKEIPNAKEELEKGTIVVESPTWSNNVAKVQVSTTTGYKIEYQINTATNSGWIQGSQTGKTTISNLKNGDFLRIRLSDGINKGKVGSYEIGEQPDVSITKQQATANSITVQVVSNNKEYIKETGSEYSYYIKKASDTNYPTTPTYKGTSNYTFNNLVQGTNYDIKVEVINKVGNKIEAIGNIVTEAAIPKLAIWAYWYKSSYDKANITSITFRDSYSPTGTETESWDASAAQDKTVMAYRTGNSIIIAGNGSGFIKANEESYFFFSNFQALTSINNIDILDTNNVIRMNSMFASCKSLTSLDLSKFDTSMVEDMSYMFSGCTSLVSLDVSKFDTSNVNNVSAMFQNCYSLKSLDVSGFNTSKVQYMNSMFSGCSSLTSLDVSKFDTSNANNMNSMFGSCISLTNLNVSKFNTSKVTNMGYMFYCCVLLNNLDVSGFNTSNVQNMSYMFSGCTSLVSLDVSKFNTSNVTDIRSMFFGDFGTVLNGKSLQVGMMKIKNLDVSGFNTSKVQYMNSMFSGCSSLTNINVSNFNTNNVTDMNAMFMKCSSLTSLDVSGFNTSKVTTMTGLFSGCSSLNNIDVSGFNTSKVTTMSGLFSGCSSLKNIDVSKFDTSNVNTISSMFSGCSSLTSLNVSDFDTKNVTDMSYMFSGCSSLKSLNIKNINTSNVKNINAIFQNCSSLTSIDVSSFDTSNVISMNNMFGGCSSLTSLNLNNFNTSNVTDMGGMFRNCLALTSLDLSKFDTSKVIYMNGMFYSNGKLTTIYASSAFTTAKVTNSSEMFAYCYNLKGAVSYNASRIDASMANYTNGYFTYKAK